MSKSPLENAVALIANKWVWNAVFWFNLKNDRIISVCSQSKTFKITIIQVYTPTTNDKEPEVNWSYEDL